MANEAAKGALDAASVGASSQISAVLSNQLSGILGAIARRVNITQVVAGRGSFGDIDIDRIVLGDAHIDKLVLQGVSANLNSASAHLTNVRMVIELKFRLDWWVDVLWIEDDGSEDLGSISFPLTVGDVNVPSLSNIAMSIPSMSAENLSTSIAPIINLDLGGGTFTGLDARDSVAPADGFQMNGLGVGQLSLSTVQIPRTTTRQARIQQFKPNRDVVVPNAEVNQLQLPAATAGNIQSGAIAFDGIASSRSLSVNFGIFGFSLRITPVAHMNIGSMQLKDVSLSATVNTARIENIRVPLDIRGIALKNVELAEVAVNDVSL